MTSATGQTADGWWEVSVRRTVALDHEAAWTWVRRLIHDDEAVREVRSETPGRVLRVTYQQEAWAAPSTLQLRVLPAATGTTIAVHNEHLPDSDTREAMRRHWTAALDELTDGRP